MQCTRIDRRIMDKNQTYLKNKPIVANIYRTNHHTFQHLIVLLILGRSHVYQLPFQICSARVSIRNTAKYISFLCSCLSLAILQTSDQIKLPYNLMKYLMQTTHIVNKALISPPSLKRNTDRHSKGRGIRMRSRIEKDSGTSTDCRAPLHWSH